MTDSTLFVPPAPDDRVWLLRFPDERGDNVKDSGSVHGETLGEVRSTQERGYWPDGRPGAWAVNDPDHWVWADDHYPSRLELVARTIGQADPAGNGSPILGGWGTEEQVRELARAVLDVLDLCDEDGGARHG